MFWIFSMNHAACVTTVLHVETDLSRRPSDRRASCVALRSVGETEWNIWGHCLCWCRQWGLHSEIDKMLKVRWVTEYVEVQTHTQIGADRRRWSGPVWTGCYAATGENISHLMLSACRSAVHPFPLHTKQKIRLPQTLSSLELSDSNIVWIRAAQHRNVGVWNSHIANMTN